MHKHLAALAILCFATVALGDTPPAREVNSETYDASGNPIGSTSGSLNVNVTNPASGLATAALQTTGNSLISALASQLAAPGPLPTGAATYAEQVTTASILSTISGQLPSTLGAKTVANSLAVNIASDQVVPVSVSSLPLPSGAATSANQSTEIGSLSAINSKTLTAGQKTMANSYPVTIASDQSALPVTGTFWQATQPVSVSSLPLPAGAATSANQTTGNGTLSAISGQLPATLGQKTSANSEAVVLASDQSPIPITGSVSATNPSVGSTGAATPASATLVGGSDGTDLKALLVNNITGYLEANAHQAGTWSMTATQSSGANLHVNVDSAPTTAVTGTFWQATQPVSAAALPLPSGAATSALQTTGNSALSTISGQLPTTLGQKTSANSEAVVLASDQSAVPVTQSGTWSMTAAAGHAVLSTFTQSYSSTNLTTGAFITIISSTTAAIDEEDVFDTSGGDYYLAYAASCGALSTSTNAIIISPGGGGKDFLIPSGNCVGFQAKTANITSGYVNMTFYK